MLIWIVGCFGRHTVDSHSCEEKRAVDVTDESLGFTADQVLSILRSGLPSTVQWDEITLGQKGSELTLVITTIGEQVFVVENAECNEGAVLRVPLNVTLALDEGEVAGSGTLWVDAISADSLDLITLLPSKDLPVELSGKFEMALDRHLDKLSEERAYTVYFVGDESWSRAEVDIEVDYEGTGIEALWRGHWEI